MHQLDGSHRAFPGAHPAAQAFGRVDIGRARCFTHHGHLKWTNAHTRETPGAFFPDHPGHRPAHQHLGLGQDAHGPGRGALGLGDGFISILGAMRQAAQENPVGGKIQGPQFHVGLQEEAVRIHGQLENLGDLLAARMRPDRGGQYQIVRRQGQWNLEILVKNRHLQPAAIGGDLGLAVHLKAAELHPQLPGL